MMGMVVVARLAANAAGTPAVTMRSTLSLSNSSTGQMVTSAGGLERVNMLPIGVAARLEGSLLVEISDLIALPRRAAFGALRKPCCELTCFRFAPQKRPFRSSRSY